MHKSIIMTSILIIAVAAVIGELLGTIVGHEIGLQMDRNDRQRTRDGLEKKPHRPDFGLGQSRYRKALHGDTARHFQRARYTTMPRVRNRIVEQWP